MQLRTNFMMLSFLLFPVINIWTDRKETACAPVTMHLSELLEKFPIVLNTSSKCDSVEVISNGNSGSTIWI